MWLNTGFPWLVGHVKGFHVFPGGDAHMLANEIKMFAADGIDGLFIGGEQLEAYLALKLLDDPDLNIDTVRDEFFGRYYGAAGKPIQCIYTLIEQTYLDRSNYPPSFHPPTHETEEIAWKYLGTKQRMDQMARWMEEARAAKVTDIQKQRVALFDKGTWQYMVEGRRVWDNKQQHGPEMEKLKKAPPPAAHAPAVPDAGGDLDKVDWSKAEYATVSNTHEGYPAERQIAVEIAHDANYLYLRLTDPIARDKVKSEGGVFDGDRWEIFLAAQRGATNFRQFGIKPDGRLQCNTYPGCSIIESGAKAKCQLDDKGWVAEFAAPLSPVRALPNATNDTVYLNLYRPASGGQTTLAWSPNFADAGFTDTARLGEVTIDK